MRNIKYILIDETVSKSKCRHSCDCLDSQWGYHYVVSSKGTVLNPIDVSLPGSFMPKPTCGQEDLNKCSIGIKYNGSLEPGTWNLELRAKLLSLLVVLRSHFPNAKILGVSELDGREVHSRNIVVSEAMNVLRRELSDLP